MSDYAGQHTELGFQVQAAGTPLPLHLHYTRSRDWRTEAGLRQIALDILIRELGVPITPKMLACKDSAVAAWIPHLHYAATLTSILWVNGEEYEVPVAVSSVIGRDFPPMRNGNHVRRRYGGWELSSSQIQLWLNDWMHETHSAFLRKREPNALHQLRYAEWEYYVKQSLATDNLDRLGISLAWRYRWYLTGYSVKALTESWNARR